MLGAAGLGVGGLFVVSAVGALTLVNYFGIKRTGRVNTVIVAVTVGMLACFVAAGAPAMDSANFRPFAPAG